YRAPGGYGGWRALAATSRRIGPAWIGAFLRYDDLRGAAFDASPLVRRERQVTVGIGVSWVFATSLQQVRADD
ncbi:MAG: MipA/OmpV family protein, partial [Pseudomonadota bacterium]|nr:MipA/OmpV family protein [Pseudomonadota bacterium]